MKEWRGAEQLYRTTSPTPLKVSAGRKGFRSPEWNLGQRNQTSVGMADHCARRFLGGENTTTVDFSAKRSTARFLGRGCFSQTNLSGCQYKLPGLRRHKTSERPRRARLCVRQAKEEVCPDAFAIVGHRSFFSKSQFPFPKDMRWSLGLAEAGLQEVSRFGGVPSHPRPFSICGGNCSGDFFGSVYMVYSTQIRHPPKIGQNKSRTGFSTLRQSDTARR